jgi:hypothetical protein
MAEIKGRIQDVEGASPDQIVLTVNDKERK